MWYQTRRTGIFSSLCYPLDDVSKCKCLVFYKIKKFKCLAKVHKEPKLLAVSYVNENYICGYIIKHSIMERVIFFCEYETALKHKRRLKKELTVSQHPTKASAFSVEVKPHTPRKKKKKKNNR